MRTEKEAGDKATNSKDNLHFDSRGRILQKTLICLNESSVEDLTVSHLCRKAGISRTKFYRLFSDKCDVFIWFYRVTMRSTFAQVGDVFPWDQAIMRFFRQMDANRKLCRAFLAARGEEGIVSRQRAIDCTERALLRTVKLHLPQGTNMPYRYQFEIRAFSRAFVLALADWLKEDSPSYAMIDNILAIVPHDLYKMLNTDANGETFSNESIRETDDAAVIQLVAEEIFTDF